MHLVGSLRVNFIHWAPVSLVMGQVGFTTGGCMDRIALILLSRTAASAKFFKSWLSLEDSLVHDSSLLSICNSNRQIHETGYEVRHINSVPQFSKLTDLRLNIQYVSKTATGFTHKVSFKAFLFSSFSTVVAFQVWQVISVIKFVRLCKNCRRYFTTNIPHAEYSSNFTEVRCFSSLQSPTMCN